MKVKTERIIVCIICILSIVFVAQFSAQAAVIDTVDQKKANNSEVIADNYDIKATALSPDVNLPSEYSSKELGYTTPVRNQMGSTCWAYSAMSSLETLILKSGDRNLLETADNNLYLSPMHLCGFATPQNATGWLREYISAGYLQIPMGYLTSWSGAKAEKDFPETTLYEDFADLDAVAPTIAGVNSIINLKGADHDTIKNAIYKYGSVAGNL